MASKFLVSLITPTYNEKENIGLLTEEIFQVIGAEPEIDLELIIVDDNSPDGTGEVAEGLTGEYPVRVIHRAGKLGLGGGNSCEGNRQDPSWINLVDLDKACHAPFHGKRFASSRTC